MIRISRARKGSTNLTPWARRSTLWAFLRNSRKQFFYDLIRCAATSLPDRIGLLGLLYFLGLLSLLGFTEFVAWWDIIPTSFFRKLFVPPESVFRTRRA
jgi:hypothetical protein